MIAIGRSPSNQISFPNDTRLAPVQAVLRSVAGRWIIEAREGGPIRVGNGRPAQFAWLNSGDVIQLTEAGPEVIFTLEATAAAQPVSPPLPTPRAPVPSPPVRGEYSPLPPLTTPPVLASGRPVTGAAADPARAEQSVSVTIPRWMLSVGGGTIAATLLIALGMFLTQQRNIPAGLQTAGAGTSSPAATDPGTLSAAAAQIPATDPRQALYCLQMRTADRTRTVQLGTAWAVAPRQLVTTGDAARGIALNQEFYPLAFARHTLTGEEFEISGLTLHPQYEAAAGRLEQAVREIRRLQPEFEQAADPEDRKKLETLLLKLDSEAVVAADESVNVNFAVLEITKDSPALLSWSRAPSMKVGQQLTLVGHPLSKSDTLVDPDRPVPLQQSIGRLQHSDARPGSATPCRALIRFADPMKDQNWTGSPVLSADGAVIGQYSRPTPPPPGIAQVPLTTHDIAILDGVRNWLPVAKPALEP